MDMHDIYVVAKARSYDYVQRFLELWQPVEPTPTQFVYSVPEFSTYPTATFATPEQVIRYLIEHPTEHYALYFAINDDAGIRIQYAMLFFNEDGGMVVGISVPYRDDIEEYAPYLQALARAVDGEYGMVLWESPPPSDTSEFLRYPLSHTNATL